MTPSRTFALAALLALAATPAGCDHGDHSHAKSVEIRFAAQVGEAPFACDQTYSNLGTTNATARPLDFRLYVHELRLVDDKGRQWPLALTDDGLWQRDGMALLDFEDKSGTCMNGTPAMNRFVRGTYDPGHESVTFTGLTFKVGVPFELNHGDAATAKSPLNLSGLFWNWQAGYKFARLDLSVIPGGDASPRGFNIHLGSMGCELAPATQRVSACAAPNRGEVALSGFDPAKNTVVIDLAAIVADVDLLADQGGAPGCMSGQDDPECDPIFASLGVDLTTGAPTSSQTAFRVE